MPSAFRAEDRALVRRELTRVAIALARHRAAAGTYPQSLDELVPDFLETVPIDRQSGEPLKYVRTEAGYKLWGVGFNGIDDGGVPPDEALDGESYDEVLEIPIPVETPPWESEEP